MGRQNVVNAIPMNVIWDASWRVLEASRVGYVGRDQIREHLRLGKAVLLVADIGSDLIRISGKEAFAFWKDEAVPRLVPPDQAEFGFHLADFPGEYCYLASTWAGPDLVEPVILFERYH